MDTITGVVLIFGAAFAWIGMTVLVILHLRRRRNGSTLVASAPSADPGNALNYRPWHHGRPAKRHVRTRRHRLRIRKVRR